MINIGGKVLKSSKFFEVYYNALLRL